MNPFPLCIRVHCIQKDQYRCLHTIIRLQSPLVFINKDVFIAESILTTTCWKEHNEEFQSQNLVVNCSRCGLWSLMVSVWKKTILENLLPHLDMLMCSWNFFLDCQTLPYLECWKCPLLGALTLQRIWITQVVVVHKRCFYNSKGCTLQCKGAWEPPLLPPLPSLCEVKDRRIFQGRMSAFLNSCNIAIRLQT